MQHLPQSVHIVEVGPRDGLQNEPQPIAVTDKVTLIEQLASAGLPMVESGSFVSPKWIPQMAGSSEVFSQLSRQANTRYSALVPNLKGFDAAVAAQVDEVAIFTAVTDSFCQRNINCTVRESLARFEPIMAAANAANIPVRGYLSCCLGCPYDGAVAVGDVATVAQQLHNLGCYQVVISDTVGVGTPGRVQQVIHAVQTKVSQEQLAVHFHDTYGQALANVFAALQCGIRVVDSAIAGLGGCPYAKGAAGNLATEDLVYMLHGLGISTGVDLAQLIRIGNTVSALLGKPSRSRVALANAA